MAYLNDRLVGETPVTFDFQWYGSHRLTLRKDGYERVDARERLRAPFYLWIPLDLVMELVPFTVRDDREWSYAMTEMPQETVVPNPPAPEAPPTQTPETTGAQP